MLALNSARSSISRRSQILSQHIAEQRALLDRVVERDVAMALRVEPAARSSDVIEVI
jgi:hypothetical protein